MVFVYFHRNCLSSHWSLSHRPFTIVFNVPQTTARSVLYGQDYQSFSFNHFRGVSLIRFVVICSLSTSLEVDIAQRVLVFTKTWSVPIYLCSLSQQDPVHGVTVGGCPLWLWLVVVQYIAHLLMASDGWFLLTNLPVSIFVFVKFHNQMFSVALELVFRLQLWCIRVDSDPS